MLCSTSKNFFKKLVDTHMSININVWHSHTKPACTIVIAYALPKRMYKSQYLVRRILINTHLFFSLNCASNSLPDLSRDQLWTDASMGQGQQCCTTWSLAWCA